MDILVLEGDGIGPEITAATVRCLEALRLGLALEAEVMGWAALERYGTTLPDHVFEKARAAGGILLGPISHADYPARERGGLNPSGELRRRLDLYANIRPSRTREGIAAPARALDVVVVRENTEGFYADRNMAVGLGEFAPTPDVALAVRKVTRAGCRRIAEAAFELATRRRGHVTAVHKANVLRLTDGWFLEEVEAVAARYPQVRHDEYHIDAMCAQLIRTPEAFDVILATNMFGDILSNIASELAGSLGLASSLNQGEAHAAANAAHGSAPTLEGQDAGNPTGLLLSAAMLLDWLGRRHGRADVVEGGTRLAAAVEQTLAAGERTRDVGGSLGTRAFGEAVRRRL